MKRLLVMAVLMLSLTMAAGCGKKEPQPEELLTEYIDLLNEEKYEEMYAYLKPMWNGIRIFMEELRP